MAALTPLRISITSDNICPFCFIGLRKLQTALKTSPLTNGPNALFAPQLRFLPFELDGELPIDAPVDKRERYLAKFGPRFEQMEAFMKEKAREQGIDIVYEGGVRSTFLAHRFLEYAYDRGGWKLQGDLIELFFTSYFEQTGDPGDPVLLSKLAAKAGVFPSEEAALEWTKTKDMVGEVERGLALARARGISGVPFFDFQVGEEGKVKAAAEVPGAQESTCFQMLFEKMAEKAGFEVASKMEGGAACEPGGTVCM